MARQRDRGAGAQRQLLRRQADDGARRSTATSRKPRPSGCCWKRATSTSPATSAPQDIAALAANPDIKIDSGAKGTIYYLGLNQKNADPGQARGARGDEVARRLRRHRRHASSRASAWSTRTSCPRASSARCNENPYKLDVDKAKALLAKAGLPNGFKVTMDMRNTSRDHRHRRRPIQQTMAEAGIKIEIIPGDGKQTLTKYRARNHDIYIGQLGPGLSGPAHQRRHLRAQPRQRGRRRRPSRWPGATPGTSRR